MRASGRVAVAVDIPDQDTRIILATNTFEVFDIEELERERTLLWNLLKADPEYGARVPRALRFEIGPL